MNQLDLFQWAETRPNNVIDALPALLRRIRIEKAYQIPRPSLEAKVLPLERGAA